MVDFYFILLPIKLILRTDLKFSAARENDRTVNRLQRRSSKLAPLELSRIGELTPLLPSRKEIHFDLIVRTLARLELGN